MAQNLGCVPERFSFDEDEADMNHEFNFIHLENTRDPFQYVKKCNFCNTHLHNRADQPLCIPDWQKEMMDKYGKDAQRHIARMRRMLAPPFGRYQEDIDADELNELEAWHRDWEEKSRS
jgi:hypothetical protein